MKNEIKVFAGRPSRQLATAICNGLAIPLGQAEIFKFSNDNTFVKINENVREADVFIVQTSTAPVDQNLMELLIMADALRRASAARITAVLPYYPYGRSDKKDQPRVPITARLVADLLIAAGVNRVIHYILPGSQRGVVSEDSSCIGNGSGCPLSGVDAVYSNIAQEPL
jgi:ribose-phosphate pyrophosphokinase